MRLRQVAAFFVVLGIVSPLAAQGWFGYTSEADQFTVNFPAEPEVEEITYPSEYGAEYPGRVYTVRQRDNVYSVTVIDYRDSRNVHLARTNSTEADSPQSYDYWRIDVLASIAYAATNFRRRGGEVTFDAWAHIDRVPGHQLQITNQDGSRTYAGIYLHERRLYIIDATVPAGAPPQGHFQQSLGFIDDDSVRVRYGYNDDWQLVPSIGTGGGAYGGQNR